MSAEKESLGAKAQRLVKQLGEIAVNAYDDKERMDWLENHMGEFENVRATANSENCTVREAIDLIRKPT